MILEKVSETCEVFLVIRVRYTSSGCVLWSVTASAHTHKQNQTGSFCSAKRSGHTEARVCALLPIMHRFTALARRRQTALQIVSHPSIFWLSLPLKVKTKSLFKPSAPLRTLAQPQIRILLYYPAGSSLKISLLWGGQCRHHFIFSQKVLVAHLLMPTKISSRRANDNTSTQLTWVGL